MCSVRDIASVCVRVCVYVCVSAKSVRCAAPTVGLHHFGQEYVRNSGKTAFVEIFARSGVFGSRPNASDAAAAEAVCGRPPLPALAQNGRRDPLVGRLVGTDVRPLIIAGLYSVGKWPMSSAATCPGVHTTSAPLPARPPPLTRSVIIIIIIITVIKYPFYFE